MKIEIVHMLAMTLYILMKIEIHKAFIFYLISLLIFINPSWWLSIWTHNE